MPTGRRTSSVVVAVTLALVGLYVAVPADAVRAAIWMIAGVSATAAILIAVRRNRPADPLPWWLLAAGIGLLANGQAIVLIGDAAMYTDAPRLLAYPDVDHGGDRVPTGPHPSRPGEPAGRAGRHGRGGPGGVADPARAGHRRPHCRRGQASPTPAPTRSATCSSSACSPGSRSPSSADATPRPACSPSGWAWAPCPRSAPTSRTSPCSAPAGCSGRRSSSWRRATPAWRPARKSPPRHPSRLSGASSCCSVSPASSHPCSSSHTRQRAR